MKLNRHIILIGFMGTGKTTIGKMLAESLESPFYDTDNEIIMTEGRSINEIFADAGEEYFRQIETKALKSIIENPPAVIATGGGVILREANRKLIANQQVVLLEASVDEIYKRLKTNDQRPLLQDKGEEKIAKFLLEREVLYRSMANIVINTEMKSVIEIINEIIATFHRIK